MESGVSGLICAMTDSTHVRVKACRLRNVIAEQLHPNVCHRSYGLYFVLMRNRVSDNGARDNEIAPTAFQKVCRKLNINGAFV